MKYLQSYYFIGSSQIKYGVAYTNRIAGSGAHELEVHGALIQDVGVGGEWIQRYDFGPVIEHDGLVVGGTTDNYHGAGDDLWLIASGHYYDHGDNGTIDGSCGGCIDQTFQGA